MKNNTTYSIVAVAVIFFSMLSMAGVQPLLSQSSDAALSAVLIDNVEVEALSVEIEKDSNRVAELWEEYLATRIDLTESFSAENANSTISDTLSLTHRISDKKGLTVMLEEIDEERTLFHITVMPSNLSRETVPLSVDSKATLKPIIDEFCVYAKTGFITEDQVPESNMPKSQIKDLNPAEEK